MSNEDDITENYHRGNQYSQAAHKRAKRSKAGDLMRILKVLFENPRGLTCDEVEVLLGMRHQTCSARFTDMKKFNWIVKCGSRLTRTGSPAGVWRAVMPISGLPLFDQPQAPAP
jgi:hypothetical protein